MSLEGCRVKIPSVRLYENSYADGPGKIINAGIYLCTKHIPGRPAPMHIGSLGWVKCYRDRLGLTLLSNPPVYVCHSDETFATV